MQRQSYQVKTVLEQKGGRKKTFLAFKDGLGIPLIRSPYEILAMDKGILFGVFISFQYGSMDSEILN